MGLGALREGATSRVPVMALTATAVPRVRGDIAKSLRMQGPYVAMGSFDRPNLSLAVRTKLDGGASRNFSNLCAELRKKPEVRCLLSFVVMVMA